MSSYKKVTAPPFYPGKKYANNQCYEHHLIWWDFTGEILKPGEVVHHKNENKKDNRFCNLEKKTKAEHTSSHQVKVPPVEVVCGWCTHTFNMQPTKYRYGIKQGRKTFFCSRSCSASMQFS